MRDWRNDPFSARKRHAEEYARLGILNFIEKYSYATPQQVKMVKNDAANFYANTYNEYLEIWLYLDTLFTP